jgi:pyridoxamine 5'-phosphate oxidase
MDAAIANLRRNYTHRELTEDAIAADPLLQFQQWFDEALAADLPEPNAMTLATATPDGIPSARMVLLKGLDQRGFIFFTNYQSRKGCELTENPHAALVFWWAEMERQVRIEGRVEAIAPQESDDYFNSRPIGSQLGALASPQSQVIPNRDILEQKLQQLTQGHAEQPISRPPHWGGYRVVPEAIEFWQGRPNRLHDRLRYCRVDAGQLENGPWKIERLAP